jgi:hypothetical protein
MLADGLAHAQAVSLTTTDSINEPLEFNSVTEIDQKPDLEMRVPKIAKQLSLVEP